MRSRFLSALFLLFAFCSLQTQGGASFITPDCVRVMTDCDSDLNYWNMTSSWRNPQRKILKIDLPVEEILTAAVEYQLNVGPYDPKNKQRNVSSENYPWGNWQVRVNGQLVFDKPAGPYVTKGLHTIEIPVKALKPGENQIEIGWAKDASRVGYVYFACDLTEDSQKIKDRKERFAKYPDALRIRLILQLRTGN